MRELTTITTTKGIKMPSKTKTNVFLDDEDIEMLEIMRHRRKKILDFDVTNYKEDHTIIGSIKKAFVCYGAEITDRGIDVFVGGLNTGCERSVERAVDAYIKTEFLFPPTPEYINIIVKSMADSSLHDQVNKNTIFH